MSKHQEEQIKKWIKRIQKKSDKQAANDLISFFYREIYAYVYKQTMNKELSMDLVQEIMMSMLQSIHHYDEKKSAFRTWLYKIATYRVVDYYRSKAYRYDQMLRIEEEIIPDERYFTLSIETKLEVEQINAFVNQLDTRRQQIFRLKVFGDHSFIEIATLMNIPESTVKTKYYSALKLIRKNFK